MPVKPLRSPATVCPSQGHKWTSPATAEYEDCVFVCLFSHFLRTKNERWLRVDRRVHAAIQITKKKEFLWVNKSVQRTRMCYLPWDWRGAMRISAMKVWERRKPWRTCHDSINPVTQPRNNSLSAILLAAHRIRQSSWHVTLRLPTPLVSMATMCGFHLSCSHVQAQGILVLPAPGSFLPPGM